MGGWEIPQLRFWIDLVMMVASLVASGCAWVLARMKADKGELTAITDRHRDRLEQHERELASMARALEALPKADQLTAIKVELASLRAPLAEVASRQDSLQQQLARLERGTETIQQFLMHGGKT